MRRVDIMIGVFCIASGSIVLTQALHLDFFDLGIPGPGFLPSILAVALLALGGMLVVTRAVRPNGNFGDFKPPIRAEASRALRVWGAMLVATATLAPLGFVVSMILLVGVLILGIEGRRSPAALAAVLALPLTTYGLFAVVLRVPLPAFGS